MDVREKLVELLSEYFDIGDSYAYNLTRVKSAFACGTMGFDDFEEFDEETVEDIAAHLIAHGVTVQEWISVKDELPEDTDLVLALVDGKPTENVTLVGAYELTVYDSEEKEWILEMWPEWLGANVTHWMPLPQPPKGE